MKVENGIATGIMVPSIVLSIKPQISEVRISERSIIERQMKQKRKRVKVWPGVCQEIGTELHELNMILTKLGLQQHNFRRDRSYPYNDYEMPPNPKTCFAKDYADYHIFPFVLPAIQSLIYFARKNRVFQCRYCTFNALDYIVEYMYNNNPRFPERAQNPIPLYEIPFAKEWLKNYPRKPYPKWLTMREEDAALIIQRAVRGFLARKRGDIQEMRQFWRDYNKDMEEERKRKLEHEPLPIYSPYHDSGEYVGEGDDDEDDIAVRIKEDFHQISHSDSCFVCNRFRDFLRRQELYRLSHAQLSQSSMGSIKVSAVDTTSPSSANIDSSGNQISISRINSGQGINVPSSRAVTPNH